MNKVLTLCAFFVKNERVRGQIPEYFPFVFYLAPYYEYVARS